MVENKEKYPGVILGSYKPERWDRVESAIVALEANNVKVVVPKDKRLTTISLPDNPGFYFLQADLEEAKLTEDELRKLPTSLATEKLNFRKLELNNYKVMKRLGENCYTYVILNNRKLGKSTAYELSLAILFENQIALNEEFELISVEVGALTRDFLKNNICNIPVIQNDDISISKFKAIKNVMPKEERNALIKEALQTLLRKHFVPYDRPKDEFFNL